MERTVPECFQSGYDHDFRHVHRLVDPIEEVVVSSNQLR